MTHAASQYGIWHRRWNWVGAAVGLVVSSPASGQPLSDFLAAARTAPDRVVAELRVGEAVAQRTSAQAALLPELSANASYTRNQVEVAFDFPGPDGATERAVIGAQDQLDATLRADWTLLDTSALAQLRSVSARVDATRYAAEDVGRSVDLAVVTAYYRFAAARHVIDASNRGVQTAERNLSVLEAQRMAGLASTLDEERAAADLGRAEQRHADAQLEVALARRELVVLTGLTPSDELVDLSVRPQALAEVPIDEVLGKADDHPRVRQSASLVQADTRAKRAAGLAAVPTISAFAQERFTNAAGFGPNALWSAGVAAQWRFDASRPSRVAEAGRRAAQTEAQQRQVRLDVETAIHDAWHRRAAARIRLSAARAEERARVRAAEVSQTNRDAGTGSALALSVAERDRFDAEVARIRAEADVRAADLTLRIAAGLPLGEAP